jgi:hypothetical protein
LIRECLGPVRPVCRFATGSLRLAASVKNGAKAPFAGNERTDNEKGKVMRLYIYRRAAIFLATFVFTSQLLMAHVPSRARRAAAAVVQAVCRRCKDKTRIWNAAMAAKKRYADTIPAGNAEVCITTTMTSNRTISAYMERLNALSAFHTCR